MRLAGHGAVARVLADAIRRQSGRDREDDHARPPPVRCDRRRAAAVLRRRSRPSVRRGDPAVRRAAVARRATCHRQTRRVVARCHGSTQTRLDRRAGASAARHHFAGHFPGDRVAELQAGHGEELHLVHAYRRRGRDRRVEVLLGATGLVLLLTSVNLANLMLARATSRGREIAVRLAIGASRGRVVRQLLSESALIAGLGAAGGLLLARWISQTRVRVLNAGPAPVFVDLTSDWRLFAFIVASAFVACLLFGLGPALTATRRDPATTLEPGGRSSTDGHDAVAVRRGLVVGQVALSIVLVVGAVLFGRTLRNLGAVD